MSIDISSFEIIMRKAVKHFWKSRKLAAASQKRRGVIDAGHRAGVTAGKNMNGFVKMIYEIVLANGVNPSDIFFNKRSNVTIPGFYRPTKNWDLIIISQSRLLAAIEFKSQVGPSFGNNFNNRVEEALGNATDLKTAYREGVFGESPKPFLGYFFLLEECPRSTTPVQYASPHFSAMPEFEKSSYAARYEIFCRKLIQEEMYDAAALILSAPDAYKTGQYQSASDLTSARRFVTQLAGKAAANTAT